MIYGIYRENDEAGNPESDRAIADAVRESLEASGHSVFMLEGEEAEKIAGKKPDLVFSMARKGTALDILSRMESSGLPVINSPRAIRLCFNREQVYRMMESSGLPLPRTSLKPIDNVGEEIPFMLKKPGTHGKKGDTFAVTNPEEMKAALKSLKASGIKNILVQDFVIGGKSYKFYGIGDEIFLPDFDKPGSENVIEFARRISHLIGMDVFGGDFIYKNGNFYVVDFNDWPSFSSMRKEAGERIAQLIISRLKP
jgi:glutathione synthase/RimK-type ligase-like ATP-grasp enzyme